jgi:hypothetical protein
MATTAKTITRHRVKNDPAFQRTRENAAEFARGGKAVKLLKEAFRDLVLMAGDAGLNARLQKQTMRVLHTDPISDRGERTVGKGDASMLKDFNFSSSNWLGNILYVKREIKVDRTTGIVSVTMPAFIPRVRIEASPNTSHFQLIVMAASIDFDNSNYEQAIEETDPLPWGRFSTRPLSLSLQLPPTETLPVMVAIGITFGLSTRNKMYPTADGNFNAAAIVEVNEK